MDSFVELLNKMFLVFFLNVYLIVDVFVSVPALDVVEDGVEESPIAMSLVLGTGSHGPGDVRKRLPGK